MQSIRTNFYSKSYELTDHLGNVRAVVSDKRKPVNGNENTITNYFADSELPHDTRSSDYSYEGNYSSEITQTNRYSQTLYIPVEDGDVINAEIFSRYFDDNGDKAYIAFQLCEDDGSETGGGNIPGGWSTTNLECSTTEFTATPKTGIIDLQGENIGILRVYATISNYQGSVWVDNLSVDVLPWRVKIPIPPAKPSG
jgi:hypothetical protein